MAIGITASPVKAQANVQQGAGGAKAAGNKSAEDAKLKKTCQEMEAVFLNMLLKSMRATVPKNSLDGKGMQSETFQSMFDEELTRKMASGGGTGLADMMYWNLTHQGTRNPVATKAG